MCSLVAIWFDWDNVSETVRRDWPWEPHRLQHCPPQAHSSLLLPLTGLKDQKNALAFFTHFIFNLFILIGSQLLCSIVVVLPYIDMNQPQVYMCPPSWTPLHFPPHPIPQGHPSAAALSTLSHALNLDWWPVSYMVIHMFQCYSLKSSHPCLLPQSPKDCFYICVPFAVSHIGLSLPSF